LVDVVRDMETGSKGKAIDYRQIRDLGDSLGDKLNGKTDRPYSKIQELIRSIKPPSQPDEAIDPDPIWDLKAINDDQIWDLSILFGDETNGKVGELRSEVQELVGSIKSPLQSGEVIDYNQTRDHDDSLGDETNEESGELR